MIRVLIVDDQELVREALEVIIGAQPDMEVSGSLADGGAVVATVREARADVVVMDIRMPRTDGITATRRLREAGFARLGILILTTFDDDEYVYEALRVGATGFLLKDALRPQILAAIRAVAAGDSLLSPSLTRRLIERHVTAPPSPCSPALDVLSPREREVFAELVRGRSNAEIGEALCLGEATVKTHITSLLRKIGVRDRVQAVIWAYENGFAKVGGTS